MPSSDRFAPRLAVESLTEYSFRGETYSIGDSVIGINTNSKIMYGEISDITRRQYDGRVTYIIRPYSNNTPSYRATVPSHVIHANKMRGPVIEGTSIRVDLTGRSLAAGQKILTHVNTAMNIEMGLPQGIHLIEIANIGPRGGIIVRVGNGGEYYLYRPSLIVDNDTINMVESHLLYTFINKRS